MDTLLVAAALDNVVNALVQNDGRQQAQNQIITDKEYDRDQPTSSNPCNNGTGIPGVDSHPIRLTRENEAWTLSEDKMVWQAWLARGRYKYDPTAPSHLELAHQLKCTPTTLYGRMLYLQHLVKGANRVVKHSSVNLVTGKSAHRVWQAYMEEDVKHHNKHAWWPDERAVAKTAAKYGWNRIALFRTLESICKVKRVLGIYGLHDSNGPLSSTAHSTTFIFSLQDDGNIWRAYQQHQYYLNQRELRPRLQHLAMKLGCTLTQIEARLSDLKFLRYDHIKQCHSNGRPFTVKEDKVIGQVIGGDSRNTVVRMQQIAVQLECNVAAVFARRKQLMIIRQINEAENLPKSQTSLFTDTTTVPLNSHGKRDHSVETTISRKKNKE